MKLNPYAWLAVLLIAGALFGVGYGWGRANGVETMQDKVAAKDAALANAAAVLRASSDALRAINAEADARIKLADDQARTATQAALVLSDANDEIRKRAEKEVARWAKAKRIPACADLLNADLLKTCGVPPR